MSRTYKDKPYKLRDPESSWDYRYDSIQYRAIHKYYANGGWVEKECDRIWFRKKPGVLTKKKKLVDTEDRWMSTPSWWTREFMNRPARKYGNRLAREAIRISDLEELEDFDIPFTRKKPHVYYW